MSKQATIPAAHRCAFAGAVHLMLREPDRIAPYRDIRHEPSNDGGGAETPYLLYTSEPPAATVSKAEREAFYDAPNAYLSGRALADLVTGAYVGLGKPVGELLQSTRFERGHGKTGGWLVFDGDRLVHVGRSLEDVRTVLGTVAPAVADHRGYVMRFHDRNDATQPKWGAGTWEDPTRHATWYVVGRGKELASFPAIPGNRPERTAERAVAEVVPIRKPRKVVEPEPVAALEDAATEPEPVHGPAVVTPEPEPAVETNGPSQPDVVPPSAEVVADAATVADGLPEHVEEWLARLIHKPKADYARAYVWHVILAEPAPADPGEGWADKARRRLDRIAAGMVNA